MTNSPRPGNTKADQLRAQVEAATLAGLKVTEIIIEPKRITLRTQAVVESTPGADAAEKWLEKRRARKAGGSA